MNRYRVFVVKAALMARDWLLVELPLAQVICIALAETLEMIGQQHECTLDDLQTAVRTLIQLSISLNYSRSTYNKTDFTLNSFKQTVPIQSLQCFDTVGWAIGKASGL